MSTEKPKTFKVILHTKAGIAGSTVNEWASSDTESYTWGVGPAGDLMIFRTEYHAAFTAVLNKDVRWYCYAPGTWARVKVLDEEKAIEEGT